MISFLVYFLLSFCKKCTILFLVDRYTKKNMYLDADFGVVPLDLEAEEGMGGGRT